MLARLRGMFAFAIWDRRRRRLLLARDHFGQKPLFYTGAGRRGSPSPPRSRRCWRDDPASPTLSPFALDQYLTLRFVQPPDTFFERVRALPPAHFMLWETGAPPRIERYWDLSYGPKWEYSEAELLERIDELLAETVRLHLASDVPVGAFLSGGLDSTLIAAYAARVLGSELRTFSMGIPYRRPQRAARRGRGGPAIRHAPLRRGSDAEVGARPAAPGLGARRAGRSALDLPAPPRADDGARGEGGARRRRRRRAVRRVRPVRGRALARRLPRGARGGARPRRPQVLQRLPDQFTFKSFTHKLRWVDLMARKTGGERYAESLQYFWFNEARRAELYTPEFRARLARPPAGACLLDLFAGRQRDRRGRPDDVRRRDVAAPGPVAHDPRPGHDGVQPRVALAVPRPAVRGVHGAGAGAPQDPGPAACGTSSAGWASGTSRPRCCGGRSRASPRRSCTSSTRRCARSRRGCCAGASWCATAISRAGGAAAGGRTPGPPAGPRQPDLAAAERRGLVPALHRRAQHGGSRGRAGGGAAGRPRAGGDGRMSQGVATDGPDRRPGGDGGRAAALGVRLGERGARPSRWARRSSGSAT